MKGSIGFYLVAAFCLLGPVAAKSSEGTWKRVSATESELATTPAAIQKVILENPEILGYNSGTFYEDAAASLSGVRDNVLLKLQVKRRTYVWEGPTTCPKDDPRLTSKAVFVSAYKWSNDLMELGGSGEEVPIPEDPCAR